MGGFLNPPTHPEHTWSIRSLHGYTFSLNLTAAVEADWLDAGSRAAARRKLASWKRPELSEVQDWIKQVLAYFRHCYGANPNSYWTIMPVLKWNASDLIVDKEADELENADIHAGVHLIRQYYPEYVPKADDFSGTWGSK
jgi:hypothetical protein